MAATVGMRETPAAAVGRPPLHRFVQRIDVLEPRPGESERVVDYLPDGTTSLVLRVLADGAADAGARGPLRSAHYKIARVIPLVVRVAFWPGGAYPFFGVPVDRLAGEFVALEDLWGPSAKELLERVGLATHRRERVTALVESALVARMRGRAFEPASAMAARAAVALLARGDLSVEAVARMLGLSDRHLRRAFQSTVGVSPKVFFRIARFQRAIAIARTNPPGRWNEVARAAGYFDQSHLTADFRELARMPPGALGAGASHRHVC
jgi:AraC-like DNA-binding protein